MKRIKITVWGDVHGVGFRHAAKRKAEEFDLAGYAANMPDGSVHIEAEGEEESIYALLSWCHEGPEGSKISKVDSSITDDCAGYDGFKIEDGEAAD